MPIEKRPSYAVIYFGVGFTLGAAVVMLLLFFVRPIFGGASQPVRFAMMLAPLIAGVLLGARVAMVGLRDQLNLGEALKRAFRP